MNTAKLRLVWARVTIPSDKSTLNFHELNQIMVESKPKHSRANIDVTNDSRVAKLRADQALLLVTASEGDANMLYAVGFFVPDPFIFFEHKNIKFVVMSDLEIDRAKKQAHVDRVLSLSLYQRKLRKLGKAPAGMIDILDLLFRERGIRSLIVPANFWLC